MVVSEQTRIVQGFRRFQHLPGGGSNFFQGDPNAKFYRNGYNLWYFKGVQTPYPYLWIRAWLD